MELEAAYRAYSGPLLSFANRLNAIDPEGLVHDAFVTMANCRKPIDAPYSWLKTVMRRGRWRELQRADCDLDIDSVSPPSQFYAAMLGECDVKLGQFTADEKAAFVDSRLGATNAEIGTELGITRQAAHQKIRKVEKAMEKYLDGGVDGTIIRKARKLCAESKVFGAALESGILGGQCDGGSLVQDFIPIAERALLTEKEVVCDE